jgi:uncharacterized membrane protein
MDGYALLKTLHVLSATVLLGTGAGIAFFMWMAHRSGNVSTIAAVSRLVVLADWCFTAPAVVVQFVSGLRLARMAGFPFDSTWLLASILLFVFVGACWLPVVWLQIRARDLANDAARTGSALPAAYHRIMRWWFALGWPACTAVVAIVYLMVKKPAW